MKDRNVHSNFQIMQDMQGVSPFNLQTMKESNAESFLQFMEEVLYLKKKRS